MTNAIITTKSTNPVDFIPNYVAPKPIVCKKHITNIPATEFNRLIGVNQFDSIRKALDKLRISYVTGQRKDGEFIKIFKSERSTRVAEIWFRHNTYILFTDTGVNESKATYSKYHNSFILKYETHYDTEKDMIQTLDDYLTA